MCTRRIIEGVDLRLFLRDEGSLPAGLNDDAAVDGNDLGIGLGAGEGLQLPEDGLSW